MLYEHKNFNLMYLARLRSLQEVVLFLAHRLHQIIKPQVFTIIGIVYVQLSRWLFYMYRLIFKRLISTLLVSLTFPDLILGVSLID